MSSEEQDKQVVPPEPGDQLESQIDQEEDAQAHENEDSKQDKVGGEQFQTNKSSQILPNSSNSYANGGDKQFLPTQQNLQYYDKHDYNQEPGPPTIKKNVVEAYTKLQDYVSDIHEQITEKMKKSEEDFLYVYKEQMYTIQKELKALKKKMDDELLRQKANDKMNILTEERDYFKAEALRLDRTCKGQEREIEELQFKQKVLTEDKNYYEGFVIETKKENKALKSELLQLYKSKTAENNQLKEQQQHQEKNQQLTKSQGGSFHQTQIMMGQTADNYFSEADQVSEFRPMTQNSVQRNPHTGDIFLSEVKFNGINKQPAGKNLNTMLTTVSSSQQTGNNFFSTTRAQTQHSKTRQKIHESVSVISNNGYLGAENNGPTEIEILKQNEEKHLETIRQLRIFLEKERTALKKVKASVSQSNAERSELEQILLDCIAETKKDVKRRRAMQTADQLALSNGVSNNLKRSNLGKTKNPNPIVFTDDEIPYSSLNQKDKMKTLRTFISSDLFLDQIYQITFGHSKIQKLERDKLLSETAGDKEAPKEKYQQFNLTESWKQDAQTASQLFQNFKGFKYSFKPQTTQGCRTISTKELRAPLFTFSEKNNKKPESLQSQSVGDSQQLMNPKLVQKQKLYKEVCMEFSNKSFQNKFQTN